MPPPGLQMQLWRCVTLTFDLTPKMIVSSRARFKAPGLPQTEGLPPNPSHFISCSW